MKKKELPKKLQSLRESRNWSKTYVAKKLGIKTLSTYANWEYGDREPDNETLTKIAELYDVSVDFLLGRTENPIAIQDKLEKDFSKAINDPELMRWFIELPKSSEEDLIKLRTMWNLIKGEKNEKD